MEKEWKLLKELVKFREAALSKKVKKEDDTHALASLVGALGSYRFILEEIRKLEAKNG